MKELAPQIGRIERASKKLLTVTADFDELDMQFYTPYGPAHAVNLTARNSTHPRVEDRIPRRASIDINNPEGIKFVAMMSDLDKTTLEAFDGIYNEQNLAEVPTHPEGVNEQVAIFVEDLKKLPNAKLRTPPLLEVVNTEFNELIAQGDSDYRQWVWHKPEDGPEVIIMSRDLDNVQPWSENATEPQLQVRIKNNGIQTDFAILRDGSYETTGTDRSVDEEAASVYGKDHVMKEGDTVFVFDLGDNKNKKAVVDDVERTLGMRAVRKDHLDIIEKELEVVLQTRKIQ